MRKRNNAPLLGRYSSRKTAWCVALVLILTAFLPQSTGFAGAGTGCGTAVRCLDQGWNDNDRDWWYEVSQGSRLLPVAWLRALELPNSEALLLDDVNVIRLGYIPRGGGQLPIGFAVDLDGTDNADLMCDVFPRSCETRLMRQPWVGMNCSACHTGQITYAGRTIRIDGAPTLADFQSLTEQVVGSLGATLKDRRKFDRFARSVLGQTMSVENRQLLEVQVVEVAAWLERLEAQNASSVRYGHGRLDAQGHILNKVVSVVGAPEPVMSQPADAPASYPHIWNAPQLGKVQWNGIAANAASVPFFGKNTDLGALVRNTAEVIGVFAHIETDKRRPHHRSSLRVAAMVDIERQLGTLMSPRWPEELLGSIDWDQASIGKGLFERNCAGCHKPLARTDLKSAAGEQMKPLSAAGFETTDIALACNTYLHHAKSGNLAGRRQLVIVKDRIAEEDVTRAMLVNLAVGSILGQADELARKTLEDYFFGTTRPAAVVGAEREAINYLPEEKDPTRKEKAALCLRSQDDILAYKARPLNGIWATAPYLHNGSVPTLYDLLLPARLRIAVRSGEPATRTFDPGRPVRPEHFLVGAEFDPVRVGLAVEQPGASSVFTVRDTTGAPILGNYNNGHEYGAELMSEHERRALIEYLKTL
ncbi:di-heme-cytochrome C peroxidase [Prosthecomicrobium sp. N25]|uniref:di-heme-cytochrome C peroxidase n=1 Tax=Prosthecomicrobium sp. N25 TaxID=3129254 RepID=UPI00307838A2